MSKNYMSKGFSLIELMVAMVVGVIILLGLVTLFTSSSALNRSQTGLAILQENGRYAITRIKDDIEQAGRKHCVTMALPNEFVSNWEQGYLMSSWTVDNNVVFDNGWPAAGDVRLDTLGNADLNQLGDTVADSTGIGFYPLDPSFFIQGHECGATACDPALNIVGADSSASIPLAAGLASGLRAPGTDAMTIRYLVGGTNVTAIGAPPNNGNLTLIEDPDVSDANDIAIVSDCETTFVSNATWGGTSVNLNAASVPDFQVVSDMRAFSYQDDLRSVSYHVGFQTDVNDPSRLISTLFRSENGQSQAIVEGVERLDVFYLAQLQSGHVVRLTADEVQNVNGGGDVDNNGAIDGISGCIQPPRVTGAVRAMNLGLSNDNGCLWRSIYAIEVHLLMNTVSNSSQVTDDVFVYSPDGDAEQDPSAGLVSGLDGERMYRREFSAIVPVRSYTL